MIWLLLATVAILLAYVYVSWWVAILIAIFCYSVWWLARIADRECARNEPLRLQQMRYESGGGIDAWQPQTVELTAREYWQCLPLVGRYF